METTTLGYALLVLLSRGPATGYELSQKMKRPVGYFWAASHSQIYPELGRLTAAGQVQLSEGTGPGPRAKKTYTLTEPGLQTLQSWLMQRPQLSFPRSESTLKAYAVTLAPAAHMAKMYQDLADEAAATLAEWEADEMDQRALGQDDPAHPHFGSYAVLMAGIESKRASVRWAGWLAAKLRSEA